MFMYTPISIKEKKHFIKWFLKHFALKKIEATWILNYLTKHDTLLEKLRFVNDAMFCPRAIVVTSQCSDETPFLFYKEHIITEDIDKFFHDIRLHQEENIYIQLNFKQSNQNPFYAVVLEENPFIPIETSIIKQDDHASEILLNQLLQDYRLKTLKQDIDQALDDRDKKKFNKLTAMLKDINAK